MCLCPETHACVMCVSSDRCVCGGGGPQPRVWGGPAAEPGGQGGGPGLAPQRTGDVRRNQLLHRTLWLRPPGPRPASRHQTTVRWTGGVCVCVCVCMCARTCVCVCGLYYYVFGFHMINGISLLTHLLSIYTISPSQASETQGSPHAL